MLISHCCSDRSSGCCAQWNGFIPVVWCTAISRPETSSESGKTGQPTSSRGMQASNFMCGGDKGNTIMRLGSGRCLWLVRSDIQTRRLLSLQLFFSSQGASHHKTCRALDMRKLTDFGLACAQPQAGACCACMCEDPPFSMACKARRGNRREP